METLNRWFLGCVVVPRNQKTQEEEKQQSQSDDRLVEDEISFPSEIMEDILSRLPVKSILRFKSVSKPWLSIISNPSFTKLQLTRDTTALFITAVDVSTNELYFLSASHDGGCVTHLMTLKPHPYFQHVTKGDHLNGLVCSIFTHGYFYSEGALVVNPSTRKIFKLPDPTPITRLVRHFFGFDESRNEHKILSIFSVGINITTHMQVAVFCMSNYSWRKIDVTGLNSLSHIPTRSVCVNSIIHWLYVRRLEHLALELEILAFDLITEKFSIITFPPDGVQRFTTNFTREEIRYDLIYPYLIKINGCIGVVCHDRVVETNEMHIWILQDYKNRVWVRETITLPESWIALGNPFPMDSINMDEIIFSLSKLSRNVISAYVYNMKSRCFRSIQFTLNHPFLCSETVEFSQIMCYVESILPL